MVGGATRPTSAERRLRWKTETGETVFRSSGTPGTCAVQFTLGDVRGSVTFSNQGRAKFSIGTSNAPLSSLGDVRSRVLGAFETRLGTATEVEIVTIAAYTNLFDETRAIRMAFVVVLAKFPIASANRYYEMLRPGTTGDLNILRVTLCEGNLSCASIERVYRKRTTGTKEVTIFQASYGEIQKWIRSIESRFPGYAVDVSAPSIPGPARQQVKATIRPLTDPSIPYKRASFTITRYGHVEIRGLARVNEIREARDTFLRKFPLSHVRSKSPPNRRSTPSMSASATDRGSPVSHRPRRGCGRARVPPCTEGYELRLNPSRVPCCYKKKRASRATGTNTRFTGPRGCGRAKRPPCEPGYEERTNPRGIRCCYKTRGRSSSGGCGRAKRPPCEPGYEERTNPRGVRCCYKTRRALSRVPQAPNVPERVYEIDVPAFVTSVESLREVWPRPKFEYYFSFDAAQMKIVRQRFAEANRERGVRPERFVKEEAKIVVDMRFQAHARSEMTARVRSMILAYYEGVVRHAIGMSMQ